jgi:hypothetical protein
MPSFRQYPADHDLCHFANGLLNVALGTLGVTVE